MADVNVRDITQVMILEDTTDANSLVEKNGALYKIPYSAGGSGSGMDVAVTIDVTDSSTPAVLILNSTLTYTEMKAKITAQQPLLIQAIFSMPMPDSDTSVTLFTNSTMTQYMQVPSEIFAMFGLQDVDEAIGIIVMNPMTEDQIALALYDVNGVLTYTVVSIGH